MTKIAVAKWLRLWVFNVEAPGSNVGYFMLFFFFFFATLITLVVVPMLQFFTSTV